MNPKKKKITVLGSSGSIGVNTLDVIEKNPQHFEVFALAAHKNVEVLRKQIEVHHPKIVVVSEEQAFQKIKSEYGHKLSVLFGEEGLIQIASHPDVDFVMAAIVGAVGLSPFLAALESKKQIGLANKEVMVMAGEFLHQQFSPEILKNIIPVDSEHSAIFQCLRGGNPHEIESIILTASGGPFLLRENLENLTPQEALKHPNWNMGAKISIDSSTLMNKGLEVIEARWLFPVTLAQIQIVIHPQSIVHSMVHFVDGSILAHLGVSDMRIPIQYALSHPERLPNTIPRLSFPKLKELTFYEPDLNKFPCLGLAFKALEKGNVFPAVLNAANEVAVQHFLENKIRYLDIAKCNQFVVDGHSPSAILDLKSIREADATARKESLLWISRYGSIS
jgi:1-deoxy-D-xylulose-5-phosphate reductoisomerase